MVDGGIAVEEMKTSPTERWPYHFLTAQPPSIAVDQPDPLPQETEVSTARLGSLSLTSVLGR